MSLELTPDTITQLAVGFQSSKTLLSAIELGLFTELAKGPQDGESLRTRLELHPRRKGFLRCSRIAWNVTAEQRPVCQYIRKRFVPRPGQVELYRRWSGNVQRTPLWVLGQPDHRPQNRGAAERG